MVIRNATAALTGLILLLLLAPVVIRSLRGPRTETDGAGAARLRDRYRAALARSEALADAPELARLRAVRACFGAWAGDGGAEPVELGLMGNLNGYASACACSSKGRGGGLAVIGAAVRRWRGARTRALLDIGDSLLPDGEVPAVYEPLFLEKARVMAELYGLLGVDAFCPSPTDLRVFGDLSALATWSATAALRSVLTNLSEGGESDRIRRDIRFGTPDFPIVTYALCDPGSERFRPTLKRFPLDPLEAVWPRCMLPPTGVRIVVLHDVPITECVDRIPRPLERTLYVVRQLDTVESRRHPAVRTLAGEGRILKPSARGQGLSILHFLPRDDDTGRLHDAAAEASRFELVMRSGRNSTPPATAGLLFARAGIDFEEGSADTVGALDVVESRLAAHRAKVLRRLLADAPYEPDAVPERRRRLLPRESCATCHEAAVAGWEAGPHAHALTTLLEGERKEQAEAGCIRCHLSATSRLLLDAPDRTEDHPLRMRSVLSGISCLTCHDDVSSEHIGGAPAAPPRTVTKVICRRCHDSINSPSFDFDEYRKRLGCCGHAGK